MSKFFGIFLPCLLLDRDETLPAIAYFVTNNISMKLSPERNHLPKAQMEITMLKIPWKEGIT